MAMFRVSWGNLEISYRFFIGYFAQVYNWYCYVFSTLCWIDCEKLYVSLHPTHHWCFPTWSYHFGAETAPLVACETENRLQIGGACLQVITWSCSAVPVGRLSTRHGRGTLTSQVFRRLHVCRPTDSHRWWQEFLCSRTAAMELQPIEENTDDYSRRFCSSRLRRIVTFP